MTDPAPFPLLVHKYSNFWHISIPTSSTLKFGFPIQYHSSYHHSHSQFITIQTPSLKLFPLSIYHYSNSQFTTISTSSFHHPHSQFTTIPTSTSQYSHSCPGRWPHTGLGYCSRGRSQPGQLPCPLGRS